MPHTPDPITTLQNINKLAHFNTWAGLEIVSASPGSAEIAIDWREEFGQYSGFLHAGMVGGLLDTACGFAAVTQVGLVLTSHFSVSCLRPAVGARFIARAKLIKPGKTQCFARAELFAINDDAEKLVATGEAIMVVTG
ncbi:PaaI family thioesterase [Amylibacter sp.]|jgi:uncharacterized protein (TIGR00369 family)|nr:PaaI family thioesterase [Amylibacter sp.]